MNVGLLVLTVIALVIAVLISVFLKVNVGICCYAMAFIVGTFGVGLSVNQIVGFFPLSLFFQILVVTLFYGYAIESGVFTTLANKIVYACRNKPALLPFAIAFTSGFVAAIGCPPPATGASLQAIAINVQNKTGMRYIIGNMTVGLGGMCGAFLPFGLFTTIVTGLLAASGFEGAALTSTFAFMRNTVIAFHLILLVGLFIGQKAYKLNKLEMEKPAGFTKEQKIVLTIIAVMLLLVVLPAVFKRWIPALKVFSANITIVSSSAIGAVICGALHLGDERKIIRNSVPWGLLITIAGAVTMIGVINATGLTEMIGNALSSHIPALLVPAVFALLAGILSFFVDSTGVVLPLFIPIALAISTELGINPGVLVAAATIGAYAAGQCPLSTGGALAVMYCPEDQTKKVFFQMWIWAFISLAVAVVMSFVLGLVF